MHRALPPRQTKVQQHMRQSIFWKVLWKRSYMVQLATTRSKEAQKFFCIHLVRNRKQVFLPNILWSSENGFVWTLLESFSLANNDFKNRPNREPELFRLEQVSPLTADNDFNAEPFYALPSNLQLQHWCTGNYGLLKSQNNWLQHPAAKQGNMC